MMLEANSSSSGLHDNSTTTEILFQLDLMTSYNDTMNDTFDEVCDVNNTAQVEQYYIILPILLISCLIAMIVNIIVIASGYWIRRPMTPNLKMSLSLAAADAASSTMYGVLVLISDYGYSLGVFPYVVELLRLSGIVITVVHLLALSLNHYIGILKPLHYNSIVTSKKNTDITHLENYTYKNVYGSELAYYIIGPSRSEVSAVIWLLWLCPFITVMSMCAAFDTDRTLRNNFINNIDIPPEFMSTFSFRISYSSLFFVPIFIMVVCYTHILLVVRKQQTRWDNLSRVGSTRIKGKSSQKMSRERKQLEGNVRAIHTTLLILGSCFIGWTPALLIYTLTCKTGCYIAGKDLDNLNCNHTYLVLVLRLMDNILIILKMLANPIIYSIRMREIKDGTHRMLLAITGFFCKSRRNALDSSGFYYRSRLQNSTGGGTIQVRMTSVKNSRNGSQRVAAGKDENTFL